MFATVAILCALAGDPAVLRQGAEVATFLVEPVIVEAASENSIDVAPTKAPAKQPPETILKRSTDGALNKEMAWWARADP